MKKAFMYLIFISGIVLGVSVGGFLFLTGRDLYPKIKKAWKKIFRRKAA